MDAFGNVVGASKIARDITERKRAEQALAKRREEQAALHQLTERLYRARSVGDVYEAALDAITRARLRPGRDPAARRIRRDAICRLAWIVGSLSAGGGRTFALAARWERPPPICIADIERAELVARAAGGLADGAHRRSRLHSAGGGRPR